MNEDRKKHLKTVGQGDGNIADITRTALVLASLDRPGVSLQKYEHHLKIIALDLAGEKIKNTSARARAAALATVLHDIHDYDGNVDYYDDLQNANLMSVIDTRRGLPVTLSILYMHAARSQGWRIEGLRFPGHFLIRLYGADLSRDGQVIIDPFHGGRTLEAQDLRRLIQKSSSPMAELKPDYSEAISDRAILVRLLNNIKIRCLKVSDLTQTIKILERLVLIEPLHIQNHYEMGMLLAHVGELERARKTLKFCLKYIEKIEKNDLIEHQVINTLQDLDKRIGEKNIHTVRHLNEETTE